MIKVKIALKSLDTLLRVRSKRKESGGIFFLCNIDKKNITFVLLIIIIN